MGHLPATLGMCGQTMGLHAGVAGSGGARVWQAVGRGHDDSAVAQAPGSYLLSRTAG